ncbi:MAG TPA: formyltransferase family protein [Pirellulaceae bacterium]|nr:formyltransferase family protein [Pirellulaceae bacterium]HMO92499.1 formyltransferase family protein [Pirellulaceae bacterium]HMP69018.1 formyltransferase family protein [Pirellulaceae bacterium]
MKSLIRSFPATATPIAVFAYDFPHRKTRDFIVDLFSAGFAQLVILAAPKKELPFQENVTPYPRGLLGDQPLNTEVVCANLKLPYYRVDHGDQAAIAEIVQRHEVRFGVIAGARIIPAPVIKSFADGIINFHPGPIPETSGLDSLYYCLERGILPGVTTHFIDARVDAGWQVRFNELMLQGCETPEIVVENIYRLQRIALAELMQDIQAGTVRSEQIFRPAKNEPIDASSKRQIIQQFETWRSHVFAVQQQRAFFSACELGRVVDMEKIYRRFPPLIHRVNPRGWTPLVVACFNQHQQAAQWLIDRGADVNYTSPKGTSVLMYAKTKLLNAKQRDFDLLALLIRHGADVNHCDMFGKTVIDYVQEAGDSEMVEFMRSVSVSA